MKRTPKQIEIAKLACIEVLKRVMDWKASDTWVPYIELWEPGPWSIRVAEVGSAATDGSGGTACMQVEPSNMAICFAVERWLLHLLWGIESASRRMISRKNSKISNGA